MTPTAWQLACGLDAWRVTQIPRRPERQEAARAGDDHRDLLAGQRAAVLSAAYHGGAGPVGFAWVRDRAGGPVQVLAAGRGLAIAAGEQDAVLKVPAGGRGTAIGAGGLARALAVLPSWVRVAGVADSLLAEGSRPGPGRGPTEGPGIRPSLEDTGCPPPTTVWAELAVLAHLTGWTMPLPDDPFVDELRAMDERRRDCALSHATDEAVAARAAVISARVSLGALAAHVVTAMRQALTDQSWLCEEEEPQFLARPYQWVFVLEGLQEACRDGAGGRHPRSAEWEVCYGRAIPGQDFSAQLAAVEHWHCGNQGDTARMHALAWGQRSEPAAARAIGAKAGDADWDERVGSQLAVFAGPPRWPLDYLTPPGPAYE